MNIKKCDRCGKIIEPEVKKGQSITRMLGDISETISKTICLMTGVTIYSVYADKEPADLCRACEKSFKDWMKSGSVSQHPEVAKEEKPAVEEINIRTNAAGIAEENIPKFGEF